MNTHREIKLLCMTIMCTWNSSLAFVLKKGENRCHRKISAQFCFCSRWVGVLKYPFWLQSGSVWVFKQTSSPVLDEEGLQHATRWSWLHGQTRSWGTSRVKEVSPGLSISMCLYCFVRDPFATSKIKQQSQSFVRSWSPAEGLEVLSVWWERARVLHSRWVTPKSHAKSSLQLARWYITFCLNSGGVFLNILQAPCSVGFELWTILNS